MFPCSKESWLCSNPNCACQELIVDKRETGKGQTQEITALCPSCDTLYFTTRPRIGDYWGAMDDPVRLTGKEREHYVHRLDDALGIIRKPARKAG